DAMKNAGIDPSANLKFIFEGEEEASSPHLPQYFDRDAADLKVDGWIIADGPIHPSRKMEVYFGARGVTGVEITTYGAVRPLHSGNYGNWAPNPAIMLARLLASMRDDNGRILIPGFYDDVRPLT